MKRLVLFVEGEGEAVAAPLLVRKLLTEANAWSNLSLDSEPFRVGSVSKLVKDDCQQWKQYLGASRKRDNLGAILLLLDGDEKRVLGEPFCAANIARRLADAAKAAGAGTIFSVGVIFACREFESWLIASMETLAGKTFPDGRASIPQVSAPEGNLEEHPRDAKGWFNKLIEGGYKPARDQATLTQWLEPDSVRKRGMRSFVRLDHAVSELTEALRSGKHVSTPSTKSQRATPDRTASVGTGK